MRPKLNRINAVVKRGIYKDGEIEIEIGKTGEDTKIIFNGKELHNVIGAHIHMRAGDVTKLCLELYKEKHEK